MIHNASGHFPRRSGVARKHKTTSPSDDLYGKYIDFLLLYRHFQQDSVFDYIWFMMKEYNRISDGFGVLFAIFCINRDVSGLMRSLLT